MNEHGERAREAARNLANAVNEMGFDVDVFADELLRASTGRSNRMPSVRFWQRSRHGRRSRLRTSMPGTGSR